MVNYYKQIVLLSGLEYMNDYNFRALKSLLSHDLKLTKKMQNDYDRIKIADLMEEKFPEDSGLSKLIEICKNIPELADRVDILRKKLEKVKNKTKIKSESSHLSLLSSIVEAWEVEPAMVTASTEESKDSNPESCDTVTMQFLEEGPKFPLLSATSTSQAEHEPLTPQRFPTTASSSLQMPLEPTEISSTILATSQGSSAPCSTCDKASQVPPVTASSSIQTIQTCLAPSILPCSVQTTLNSPKTEPIRVLAIQTTEAIKASGHNRPQVPAAAVHSSYSNPRVTPATVSSSAQSFRLTPATMTSGCNSPQLPAATVHSSYSNPQVTPATVPSSPQTLQLTPAAMTGDCNSTKVSGERVPACYNNPQVTQEPSSVQILRMTLETMTIGCNSPHVSAATVSSSYKNPWVTPATLSPSAQPLRLTPRAMTSGCNSPQVSAATVSSSCNNTPQVSSATVPRSFHAMSLSPATPLKARIGSPLGAADQMVKDHQFEDNDPWFLEEGSLTLEDWKQAGKDMRRFHEENLSKEVPNNAFTPWQQMKDLLTEKMDLEFLGEEAPSEPFDDQKVRPSACEKKWCNTGKKEERRQNTQSGFWTGLSDQLRLSRKQSRAEKRRKQEEQMFATKMKRPSLSPPQTTARRVNLIPTWGQLKKLTREAEGLVQRTGEMLSSETMFLAMLALIATQSSSEICNYNKAGHSGTSSEK